MNEQFWVGFIGACITIVPLAFGVGCWLTAGEWLRYIQRSRGEEV